MSTTLWISFGFLAALIAFLAVTIYLPPKENSGRATLKFFTALSAGFAGGFFTGDALLKYQHTVGASTLSLAGTAGCALFFVVWLIYPRVLPQLEDDVNADVPAGWTFRNAVETIARLPCEYIGFKNEELTALTRAGNLRGHSVQDILSNVRLLTAELNVIRPYNVEKTNGAYKLRIM